jgi:transcriptional regulator with XRE-family HTH domain
MYEEKGFGHRLKSVRIEKGLTQTKFAEMLGTSKQVVSRYENNQRCPKITTAAEFAKRLDVPLSQLAYGDILPGSMIAEEGGKGYAVREANNMLLEETGGLSKEELGRAIAFIREMKSSRAET